jgi:hypothetical protein
MSTENESALDAFIRQLTKEIPLEEPNDQFTDKVLENIEKSRKRSIQSVYTPVFSKVAWMVVGFIVISLLVIGYFSGEQESVLPILVSYLAEQSEISFTLSLPSIASSRILLFSFLALICCLLIQIIWLKKSWTHKRVMF